MRRIGEEKSSRGLAKNFPGEVLAWKAVVMRVNQKYDTWDFAPIGGCEITLKINGMSERAKG